ncbi:hypothetical protein DW877_04945 [[Clostridium] symbiosum]|nr:hypothetical protein DW877_04945 [[Clostridium] symbiosum]
MIESSFFVISVLGSRHGLRFCRTVLCFVFDNYSLAVRDMKVNKKLMINIKNNTIFIKTLGIRLRLFRFFFYKAALTSLGRGQKMTGNA